MSQRSINNLADYQKHHESDGAADESHIPSLEQEAENVTRQLEVTGLPIGHKIPSNLSIWSGNIAALMPACVDRHGRIWREDGEGLTLVFDPAVLK